MKRGRLYKEKSQESHSQGRYWMPDELIERVKEASYVDTGDWNRPARWVVDVLTKECDKVLGTEGNPNPDAERILEINRKIGIVAQDTGEILFGATSSGEKDNTWQSDLDKAIERGTVKEEDRAYYSNKLRKNVETVSELTLERSKIRDKMAKKRSSSSKKRLTRKNAKRAIKTMRRYEG